MTLGAGLDGFLRDGDEPVPQLALHVGYELVGDRAPAGGAPGCASASTTRRSASA